MFAASVFFGCFGLLVGNDVHNLPKTSVDICVKSLFQFFDKIRNLVFSMLQVTTKISGSSALGSSRVSSSGVCRSSGKISFPKASISTTTHIGFHYCIGHLQKTTHIGRHYRLVSILVSGIDIFLFRHFLCFLDCIVTAL